MLADKRFVFFSTRRREVLGVRLIIGLDSIDFGMEYTEKDGRTQSRRERESVVAVSISSYTITGASFIDDLSYRSSSSGRR